MLHFLLLPPSEQWRPLRLATTRLARLAWPRSCLALSGPRPDGAHRRPTCTDLCPRGNAREHPNFLHSMNSNSIHIRTGNRWREFTYHRPGLELLGVVREGLQIGALARLPNGRYAQVNGDVVRLLNTSRVEYALASATPASRRAVIPDSVTSVPTVTVRKSRTIRPPDSSR